jgi:hypothetical protein
MESDTRREHRIARCSLQGGEGFRLVQESREPGAQRLLRSIGATTPREAAQRREAGRPRAALRRMGKRRLRR